MAQVIASHDIATIVLIDNTQSIFDAEEWPTSKHICNTF